MDEPRPEAADEDVMDADEAWGQAPDSSHPQARTTEEPNARETVGDVPAEDGDGS